VDGAAAAAEQMRELGERLDRGNLTALADLGGGRVAVARGEGGEGRRLLGAAIANRRIGLPLEEGRALERAGSRSVTSRLSTPVPRCRSSVA
jgi:hypothetical protein